MRVASFFLSVSPLPFRRWLGASLAAAVAWSCAAPAAAQFEPPPLMRQNNCLSCHDLVKKLVGPGFAQIAERYRNNPEAPAQLAGKIRGGSQGTWGRISMPQHPQLSEEEALTLARWVLSQPKP